MVGVLEWDLTAGMAGTLIRGSNVGSEIPKGQIFDRSLGHGFSIMSEAGSSTSIFF